MKRSKPIQPSAAITCAMSWHKRSLCAAASGEGTGNPACAERTSIVLAQAVRPRRARSRAHLGRLSRFTSAQSIHWVMTTRRKPKSEVPRAALVTGAGKRIGRAIALALARDGWDIAVHYATSRSEALATVAAIEALGQRAVAVNRDLAVERGVRSLISECASELGPVTCVVNNAAIFEYDTPTRFKAELLVKHV